MEDKLYLAILTVKTQDIGDRRQSFFKPRETTKHNAQQQKTPSNDDIQMVDLTMHNLAKRTAKKVWSMFPDSKIAKSFRVGPDKLKYIFNFGLVPFFKTILAEKLKKSEHYVISYHESINEVT